MGDFYHQATTSRSQNVVPTRKNKSPAYDSRSPTINNGSPEKKEIDQAYDSRTSGMNNSSGNGMSEMYDEKKEKDVNDPNDRLGSSESVEAQAPDKFNQLSWVKLTVCLIVEAIALGSLSIPSVFAKVGMVAGVILTVGLGFIAIYTSYVVGQVYLKYPGITHYADAVRLMFGRIGFEVTAAMFVIFLTLVVGSHTLTGTIAFIRIVDKPELCALIWGGVSAIILFVLALPPTFSEFAILGYIDFISIIAAIIITIVATAVESSKAPGGLSAVDWSVWPPPDISFRDAFLSVTNIIFAYSFAVCQYSFMAEMHTPTDYVKSIWALGLIEIVIYTGTGALVYVFVGSSVASPALLSAGHVVSRVAFGVALPVIFISGAINTTVTARYVHGRIFKNSPIRYIHSTMGWLTWVLFAAIITVIAWVIAEAIPFFSDLLGIISSLLISGFTFYFPALMWFMLIREGGCFSSPWNIILTITNAIVFIMGIAILAIGTYASVADILDRYSSGKVGGSFSCDSSNYS